VSDYTTVRAETHELLREISDGLRGLDEVEGDRMHFVSLVRRDLASAAKWLSTVPRVPVKTWAEIERENGGAP